MAVYCVLADIEKRLPESELVGLTDDEGSGSVDTDIVDEAISASSAVVDSFLRGTVAVPLEEIPALIKRIVLDLVVWELYTRRLQGIDLPEGVSTRYSEAMKMLRAIQAGDLVVWTDEDTDVEQESKFQTNKTSADRVFNDSDVLDKF